MFPPDIIRCYFLRGSVAGNICGGTIWARQQAKGHLDRCWPFLEPILPPSLSLAHEFQNCCPIASALASQLTVPNPQPGGGQGGGPTSTGAVASSHHRPVRSRRVAHRRSPTADHTVCPPHTGAQACTESILCVLEFIQGTFFCALPTLFFAADFSPVRDTTMSEIQRWATKGWKEIAVQN